MYALVDRKGTLYGLYMIQRVRRMQGGGSAEESEAVYIACTGNFLYQGGTVQGTIYFTLSYKLP